MRGAVLADLPFPSGCVSCGGPGSPWCERCARLVDVLVPPGCRRCGRPLPRPAHRCRECPPTEITSLRAPFRFDGPVRDALLALKFGGRRDLARPLGRAMAARWDGPVLPVTWVPLSRRRLAVRGYDQAEALAREVARAATSRCGRLLARAVDTPPQARRGAAERRRALRGAFAPVRLPPPAVILVDDVVTTGSTAAECAAALRAAGAREVHVLAAARALPER